MILQLLFKVAYVVWRVTKFWNLCCTSPGWALQVCHWDMNSLQRWIQCFKFCNAELESVLIHKSPFLWILIGWFKNKMPLRTLPVTVYLLLWTFLWGVMNLIEKYGAFVHSSWLGLFVTLVAFLWLRITLARKKIFVLKIKYSTPMQRRPLNQKHKKDLGKNHLQSKWRQLFQLSSSSFSVVQLSVKFSLINVPIIGRLDSKSL